MPRYLSSCLILVLTTTAEPGPAAITAGLAGRWDVTVDSEPDYPSWFELTHANGAWQGRFVGRLGSVRPLESLQVEDNRFRFSLAPQFEKQQVDVVFEGTLNGPLITGETEDEQGMTRKFTAHRAPPLPARRALRWQPPIDLLARGLDGWRLRVAKGPNGWTFDDGVLRNTPPSVDFYSLDRFTDFQLHIEYRIPPKSNSGIYLRGRYELQMNDSRGRPASPRINSSIYGFLQPTARAAKPPGEWNVYDLTFVGRELTAQLNGVTIHDRAKIDGITGGALDSHEGQPGPLMLQGDHGAVEYRNITIRPAK